MDTKPSMTGRVKGASCSGGDAVFVRRLLNLGSVRQAGGKGAVDVEAGVGAHVQGDMLEARPGHMLVLRRVRQVLAVREVPAVAAQRRPQHCQVRLVPSSLAECDVWTRWRGEGAPRRAGAARH